MFFLHPCRDAAAAHEAAQYQNMGLPPSLVQAAASNKSQLHQQALANLNMREAAAATASRASLEPRENFLTPPQTPVSSLSWKAAGAASAAAANAAAAASLVVPEPHKPDPRALVNNVMRHYDLNGSAASPVNNGASSSSSAASASASTSNRAGGMRQAVELKSSQPIFPGQPPPLSASREKGGGGSSSSSFGAQPPPRQSSQVRDTLHTGCSITSGGKEDLCVILKTPYQVPSRSAASPASNRTAFPGQAPPQGFRSSSAADSFLHELAQGRQQQQQQQQQQAPQQQPSPQYYNNPSPQNVASPQQIYQQNPSPQQQQQFYHHQQQQQQQQKSRHSAGGSRSSRS